MVAACEGRLVWGGVGMHLAKAVMGAVLLIAAVSSAHAQTLMQTGSNTINGHTAPLAGQAPCGSGTVFLYESFPDISGADGGVRIPRFETPTADTPHKEALCTDGTFTFKNVPDGDYLVGLPPKGGAGPVLDEMATVEGGKVVMIELKPEGVGRY